MAVPLFARALPRAAIARPALLRQSIPSAASPFSALRPAPLDPLHGRRLLSTTPAPPTSPSDIPSPPASGAAAADPLSAPSQPSQATQHQQAREQPTPSQGQREHPAQEAAAAVAADAEAPEPRKKKREPWAIERTPSGKLPVYHETKRGRTKEFTTIRKILGNATSCMMAVVEELDFPRADVKHNSTTKGVHIKGHHRDKIKAWLEAKGY